MGTLKTDSVTPPPVNWILFRWEPGAAVTLHSLNPAPQPAEIGLFFTWQNVPVGLKPDFCWMTRGWAVRQTSQKAISYVSTVGLILFLMSAVVHEPSNRLWQNLTCDFLMKSQLVEAFYCFKGKIYLFKLTTFYFATWPFGRGASDTVLCLFQTEKVGTGHFILKVNRVLCATFLVLEPFKCFYFDK